MEKSSRKKSIERTRRIFFRSIFLIVITSVGTYFLFLDFWNDLYAEVGTSTEESVKIVHKEKLEPLNKEVYDARIKSMVNGDTSGLWPAKKGEYPNAGALLPFNRIVAYYGNLYSKKMGILGEHAPQVMLKKLKDEVTRWQSADPHTPVIPALHYIATTAQGLPGKDKTYILRMPDGEIDKVIEMAKSIDAIVFLDLQVGHSNVVKEMPLLEKYWKMPNVHIGIDPEFSMKTGKKPGTVIGTMDATDINFVVNYISRIVKENNLPPKILTIHRFTEGMVTKYKNIKTSPDVQIVMDMDGWGHQARKVAAYNQVVYDEPVQFTGFKLFYKNDLKQKGSKLMTPQDVLKLKPQPMYIQYQ